MMLWLWLAACGPRLPATGAAPRTAENLGGERLGIVAASTANGRFVIVRRWEEGEHPSFGPHGELMPVRERWSGTSIPWPTAAVLDYATGEEHEITEFIQIDAARERALLLVDDALVVLHAEEGRWEVLTGADTSSDGNACLPPRAGRFGPQGQRLGWISGSGDALEVRDPRTGESWSIPAEGRLWRALPDSDDRGAWLVEVPERPRQWPQQETSCACWWCGRFAASYSVHGWSGPQWQVVRVEADGTRAQVERLPEPERWPGHGPDRRGCTLAAQPVGRLERGPWRWSCPE